MSLIRRFRMLTAAHSVLNFIDAVLISVVIRVPLGNSIPGFRPARGTRLRVDMGNDNFVVYEPHYRARKGFFATCMTLWRNLFRSRYLICQLFKRDFLFAYKRSFLSVGWFFISPLLGIVSWVIMNAAQILAPGDVGMPYPAYILLSTSIWGLFMGFYQSASDSLYSGLPFILDIHCPQEILLVKQTAQHLAGFLLGFAITIAVLLLFRIPICWTIVFFPLAVLPLFFLGASLGLAAAVVRVVMPDLKRWLDFAMQLLMFVTPVIYSDRVSSLLLQKIIRYNPLTYLVSGARDVLVRGGIEHPGSYLAAAAFSFGLFLLAARAMYLSEDKVIERMF